MNEIVKSILSDVPLYVVSGAATACWSGWMSPQAGALFVGLGGLVGKIAQEFILGDLTVEHTIATLWGSGRKIAQWYAISFVSPVLAYKIVQLYEPTIGPSAAATTCVIASILFGCAKLGTTVMRIANRSMDPSPATQEEDPWILW